MVRANIARWIGLGLLAELIVFIMLADRIGFGWAVLLSLATSLIGVATLRRTGLSVLVTLRQLNETGLNRQGLFIDGMLGAIGAALLIVPGFLTDIVGLMLQAPSIRQALARRFGLMLDGEMSAVPRRSADRTIDLGSGDWTRLDGSRQA